MKKNVLTILGLTFVFSTLIMVVSSISPIGTTSAHAFTNGSPGSRTNSPGDAANCTGCHSGSINSGNATAAITSAGLLNGYTPGQTYTINAGITGGGTSTKIGFEATAEKDAGNTKSGTMVITDAARTKLINTAVTHTSLGTGATSGSNAWSFNWTAPNPGAGSVTFYGAFNVTNSNGATSGDAIYTTSFNVTETPVGVDGHFLVERPKLFPNPATSYFQVSLNERIDAIEIYNAKGQKMMEYSQDQNKINIEKLPPGIYFVSIISPEGLVMEKLIVQ